MERLSVNDQKSVVLTTVEAQIRLNQFGMNEPGKVRQLSGIVEFLSLFANPLIIILLIASAISFVIGDLVNSTIIAVMVLLSVILNFVQTARSKKAAESLRREVSLSAGVLRDGEWCEIPRREIVPGDFIRLAAGDLVPADADLFETKNFHVQESALTGESLPVEKMAVKDIQNENLNRIFLGTSVISGTATALLVKRRLMERLTM